MSIKLGDYVLATKWRDCDPHDPWAVGYVCRIIKGWKRRNTLYVVGNADGTWRDCREYSHARKISQEEGAYWLGMWGETGKLGVRGER